MNVAVPPLFRPPRAPSATKKPLGALGILAALARNPVEIWSDLHFEHPILIGKTFFGYRAVVSDPAAMRRVFLDNAANYRKDAVQLRVLRPGLGNGLLTADGEAWKAQRRALAPLFSPRQVAAFAPAMHRVARAPRRDASPPAATARVVEAHEEMARRRAEGAGADAVQPGPGARGEPVPEGGDALFRHDRPHRSARRARRAGFPAAHRPAARQGLARPSSPAPSNDIIAARRALIAIRRDRRRKTC